MIYISNYLVRLIIDIENKYLLWHVAGAYSINKSIDLMMKDNVHLYVHMDDDNYFDKTHLFNIAFCYKFLKSDFIFTNASIVFYILNSS